MEAMAAAEERFQAGVSHLRNERYSDALAEFQRAATLDPTDPRPHHGQGKVYQKLFLVDRDVQFAEQRIVEGLVKLSPERQRMAWADMFRAWDAADPADRSLMTWTAVLAVAEMPANQRKDLIKSRTEAIALLDERTGEQALADIRGAETHLQTEKNEAAE